MYIETENYDRLYVNILIYLLFYRFPAVQTYAKTVPRRAKLLADLLNDKNLPDERDAAIQSVCCIFSYLVFRLANKLKISHILVKQYGLIGVRCS